MGKKRNKPSHPLAQFKKRKNPSKFVIDHLSPESIRQNQERIEKLLDFHYSYHFCLENQRFKHADEIQQALVKCAVQDYDFDNFKRCISIKYIKAPLSVVGSTKLSGGRFNIGDVKPQFQQFPALYLAYDSTTAMCESFQKMPDTSGRFDLDSSLTNNDSISILNVKGRINSVIDINQPSSLKPFVRVIKNFKIPDFLNELADSLHIKRPALIKSPSQLVKNILAENWSVMPTQFDIPAASQIFGQLAKNAGIEGILYRSKFTGKNCLAVFPDNLAGSSQVELKGNYATSTICPNLNAKSWKKYKHNPLIHTL